MASGKSKRTSKTSQGLHGGGGKVRLTELEKILLVGGGALARPAIGSRTGRPSDR